MNSPLPTLTCGSWTLTDLADSLKATLSSDTVGETLQMFAYAVSLSGWQHIRNEVISWKRAKSSRLVTAYVGTDHGLTAPDALKRMQADGIEVRIMVTYSGTYHPKMFWLRCPKQHFLWIGSNNLTQNGLLHNIEFAALIHATTVSDSLSSWFTEIHGGSEVLTPTRLRSYTAERQAYSQQKAKARLGEFTWTKKREPSKPATSAVPRSAGTAPRSHLGAAGDLVIEVMPQETGTSGHQVQIPKQAATSYFGLGSTTGSRISISLNPLGVAAPRTLTMTSYGNDTRRLQINELDYTDRPCVIVFHRTSSNAYDFEIVSQNVHPTRYKALLAGCIQTTPRSKRWRII